MDFSNFLFIQQEIALIAVFIVIFFCDILGSNSLSKQWIYPLTIVLFGALTIWGFCPKPSGEAFGGMFVVNNMTVVMKNVLNIATLLVLLQSYSWLNSKETQGKRAEFIIITTITLLGMYLMVSAGNFMMLYIGMETASIPMACLAAFNKHKRKSAESGVKLILISALSSSIMLFGLSFLYGATGTFYFGDMTAQISSNPAIMFGLVFFLGGLGFKLSLVPFHLWTADVYEGAPTTVTAYLSVVSKGAAAFAIIFALYRVFGNIVEVWQGIIWALTVITITLGNLFAIRQSDIKRFFAFSSISQAGYIMLGVIANSPMGITSTVFFVFVYVFSNLAAFGVISAVESKNGGNTSIDAFNGLYKTNPKLAFVMMLSVFSLGGIPIFAGFFSKLFIFMAAAQQGFWVLVFIALLNTVISLYYYLLIIKAMFIKQPDTNSVETFKTDCYNRISLAVSSVGILVVGLISGIYAYIDQFSGELF